MPHTPAREERPSLRRRWAFSRGLLDWGPDAASRVSGEGPCDPNERSCSRSSTRAAERAAGVPPGTGAASEHPRPRGLGAGAGRRRVHAGRPRRRDVRALPRRDRAPPRLLPGRVGLRRPAQRRRAPGVEHPARPLADPERPHRRGQSRARSPLEPGPVGRDHREWPPLRPGRRRHEGRHRADGPSTPSTPRASSRRRRSWSRFSAARTAT